MYKTNKISCTSRISFILVSLFFFLEFSQGIQWLTLGKESVAWNSKNKATQCLLIKKSNGFIQQQVKLCLSAFEAMPFVVKAAEETVFTCQKLFEKRRWNCSTILTAPNYTPDLSSGTREQAFVYALSSAAMAYTMSKACASGSLFNCSCSGHPKDPPNGNFQWGGCGDNIRWGLQFSKHFTDSAEKRKKNKKLREKMKKGNAEIRGLNRSKAATLMGYSTKIEDETYLAAVNLQNNRAGRKVIEMSLKIQCKCHGVSGSCSIKICWKALPKFIEIGERLQKKYGTSFEVVPRKFGPRRKLVSVNSGSASYNGDDLVYTTKSPDYCLQDDKTGSLGTRGRPCNRTSQDYDSCDIMCCGRGHITLTTQKIEMCKCRFHWCCNVVCKKCPHWVDTHICN